LQIPLWRRRWIDAGENPAVRHEGVPPSNNLIKDGTHRATVFVGHDPEVISFSFTFRNSDRDLYGGDSFEYQENSEHDRNVRDCERGINSGRCSVDECSGQEISDGQNQTGTSEVRQNYIRRLQESKEGSGPLTQRLFPFRTNSIAYYGDQKL
jgi:hypothetical protein